MPGQTVTEKLEVTAPATAPAGDDTLALSVVSLAGHEAGPSGLVEASATVTVPFSSLAAAYNNTGISDNSDEAAASLDGSGDSLSAQALAAATPPPGSRNDRQPAEACRRSAQPPIADIGPSRARYSCTRRLSADIDEAVARKGQVNSGANQNRPYRVGK